MNGHAPELVRAMNHIQLHPEEWDQGEWFCGTKACLAGRICLQNGWTPMPDSPHTVGGVNVTKGALVADVVECAMVLAQISNSEVKWLFSHARTLIELIHAVHNIDNDRAIVPYMWQLEHTSEHVWRAAGGAIEVMAHRRTTAVRTSYGWRTEVHATRDAAHDYAGDVASCRDTEYTRNDHIWSPK